MCDMKTHSNNCSGPLVGNALGKVILISTPRDANTRYNRELEAQLDSNRTHPLIFFVSSRKSVSVIVRFCIISWRDAGA